MAKEITSNQSLRNFIIVWIGQLISAIGSSMTTFAIEIWVWEVTGEATSFTLLGFFTLLPSIAVTMISGLIVDRYQRKLLMIIGDTVAVLVTIIIILLYVTKNLQIWHLYITGAIAGIFSELQYLAYSASVGLMIPKKHYSRASSMEFLSSYGSQIIAPAFAGYLYHVIGLLGISLIDIFTFTCAITSIFAVKIPQPAQNNDNQESENIFQQLGFSWRYIYTHKNLLALLTIGLLFWFFHDLGGSIYTPMILARSNNNTIVLGSLASAAGIGGVVGALIMGVWGGPKRPINGFLWGMIGAGISKIIFGLGNSAFVWISAQFCSSLNFPLNGSSENTIWLTKVAANIQGRVFAVRSLLLQFVSAMAYLIAGPIVDSVFEPAMKPGGQFIWLFAGIFGTDKGAGMALLYTLCALCMLLVGVGGYFWRPLHISRQRKLI
ncbi:MAG: MFS transporter [Nostocaceae cyanobacterium]|nr:MFS transporter [Nostocaceae cyanobacterium]